MNRTNSFFDLDSETEITSNQHLQLIPANEDNLENFSNYRNEETLKTYS